MLANETQVRFYGPVHEYRIPDAAEVLGVSDDTVRRWVDQGRLAAHDRNGRRFIEGTDLARAADELAGDDDSGRSQRVSARNSLPGIVTRVVKDTVMAQVEMRCGPHRLVSLMSREAADALGLEVGVRAIASVKSTNVIVETA